MKKNTSILIAERVSDLADLLADYLTEQGFSISIARDGVIARRKLLSYDYDFLITDVMLPEVAGLQLLTWLKQQALVINVVVSYSINFELLTLPNQERIILRLSKPYSKKCLLDLVTKLKKTQKKLLNNDI